MAFQGVWGWGLGLTTNVPPLFLISIYSSYIHMTSQIYIQVFTHEFRVLYKGGWGKLGSPRPQEFMEKSIVRLNLFWGRNVTPTVHLCICMHMCEHTHVYENKEGFHTGFLAKGENYLCINEAWDRGMCIPYVCMYVLPSLIMANTFKLKLLIDTNVL